MYMRREKNFEVQIIVSNSKCTALESLYESISLRSAFYSPGGSVLMERHTEIHTMDTKSVQKPREYVYIWRNIIVFIYVHFSALYGMYLLFHSAKFLTAVQVFILMNLGNLGITCGAHRLWAHRAYKAKTPLKIILVIMETLAFQNSVIHWCGNHRMHHKYSDTDADPHNSKRGFFFAHAGWLLTEKHPDVLAKEKVMDLSDLTNDPLLKFQHSHYPQYCLSVNSICLVNSAAHLYGGKPYDKFIKPSENFSVAAVAGGEGWHNYHHTFPWDYKTSELGKYSLNWSTAFIDFFAKIGWAYDLKTDAEKEKPTMLGRMATKSASKSTTQLPTLAPGPSKKSAREERRIRRRGEAVDTIRLLQEALPLASESSSSEVDSDGRSTIGSTLTGESAMDTEEFQLPSARQQRKRKTSRNFSSDSDRRKRSETKLAPAGESQPVQAAVPNYPKAKEGRVPPVVLRKKARWMAVDAEMSQQSVHTTKVVNTNVGIRIQPASANDYRQLICMVSALKIQFHSYQLMEEKPLKVVIRGVSEEITEDEVTQDLARQGFHHASCKRMVVGAARRPIPLIFFQMAKSKESKRIFSVTHVCGMNVTAESKQADVAVIPKPGQSHNWPQNYRPISLLPVMGKIADRIILTRLREETDDLDVIPNCQFGFRREHSTTHQVLRLVEQIKEGFNRRECTGAVFLDVAKAFDKVWHQSLLLKMHRADISKAMVRLIHSFLRKRTFKIKLDGQRSTARTTTAGVPQRSAISPLLFNIYNSDIRAR
ncbi:Desat1 [Trypoxylus dichotomus]